MGSARLPLLAFSLMSLSLIFSPPAHADRRLSLRQAAALAVAENPELRLEDAKILEARARQKSTRGLYGPKLMADVSLLVWDSALTFKFDTSTLASGFEPSSLSKLGLTSAEMATLSKYSDVLALAPKLLSNFDLGNIRDQLTFQMQLILAQPLTPLLQIHEGYKATEHLTASTILDKASKQSEVVNKVAEIYLQLMQAQRLVEVAQTGVDQVSEHVKRARQFLNAGLIGRQDVLKAQVQLARAR
jgi:outer membrane protein TolC